jgi:transmembrane sensor
MRNNVAKPSREIIVQASAWLIEFRTDEPTPAQRDEFNAWLCTSPQHIQAYLEVAGAWSELPDNDPEGRIDIEAMIRSARETDDANVTTFPHPLGLRPPACGPSKAARLRPQAWLAAAASVLVVVVLGMATYLYSERDAYATGTGEQRSLTLADGSTVELNSQSKIRVRFTDTARNIELIRGQALFQVAKDNAHPFIVDSGHTKVRAVGTQFDVYRRTTGTIVTVVEGTVAVATEQYSGPKTQASDLSSILLAAGEQLTIPAPADQAPNGKSDAVKMPQPVDIETATAWTQKRLVFENTPLSEVAEEFNRYSSKPLVIDDPSLQQLGVSGLYSSSDPTALIAFLSTQPGILVTQTNTEIRITLRP